MVIPKRQMEVIASSPADRKDSTAFGVDTQVLTYFVSTTIALAFPPQR